MKSELVAWLLLILAEDAMRNGGHEEDCESYLQRKCDCIHGWALVDIKAKRAIVEVLDWQREWEQVPPDPMVISVLATAYADRPGYRDEWWPEAWGPRS